MKTPLHHNGNQQLESTNFDYIIIGSGFGGSVCALRLTQKGYKVLVVEKGRRFAGKDFPTTNWQLRKWLWLPQINWRGPFKMSFFRHVTVFSGVGVGGGSLIYANTLPIPPESFYQAKSWQHLADWKAELAPHYLTARRMLGATINRHQNFTDDVMKQVASDLGISEGFQSPYVSIYQGTPGETVQDPYFDGMGPNRTGCIQCGACMLGCPHNAKNTLDKNYLYLAESGGATILADTMVELVTPQEDGSYRVTMKSSKAWQVPQRQQLTTPNVIFAGGVLGTLPLLLKLKAQGLLPRLSETLGQFVRTNNESITGILSNLKHDFSKGIAISSLVNLDPYSHVEPVRYNQGSSFFRLLMAPHGPGTSVLGRLGSACVRFFKSPLKWMRFFFGTGFSTRVQMLLYMQSLEGTLGFKWQRSIASGFRATMKSHIAEGSAAPTSFLPGATDFAERFAKKVDGLVGSLATETLLDIPSTAHILGGCCMGKDTAEGVISHKHEVFGYKGLYVIDGSAISANPGVNPSLTITALAERAMSFIPSKPARS